MLKDRVISLAPEGPNTVSDPEHQSKDLADLVIAGLAIRCGIDMACVSSAIPAMTPRGMRHALSNALTDPDSSVRFFEMMDGFEAYFRDFMRIEGVLPDAPCQSDRRTARDASLNMDTLKLSPMPVQKRP